MSDEYDSESPIEDIVDPKMRMQVCISRVRRFLDSQSDEGFYGVELVYALSYVATEKGLMQTNNGFYVLPRILEGIVDAGFRAHQQERDTLAEADSIIEDPDSNVTSIVDFERE